MVSVWSVPSFVAAMLAAPPVVLESAPDCPSSAAISRELERIVAAPAGTQATDTALVAAEGSELRIVLATKDGALLGERRLSAEGTCDERARSVAVVLGAWIATAHPEYLSPLPAEQPEIPEEPAEPSPPPDLSLPPPAVPAPAVEVPRRVPPARLVPAPHVAWRFHAAFALGVELSDAGLMPAADVSSRYAPEASGFGLAAFALLAGPEVRDVGEGRVRSFRWPLGVGGLGRLQHGDVAVELEAGAMLGWLSLKGEGFSTNGTATDVQGGIHGGVRAGFGSGSGVVRPFAAARLLAWLGQVTASAELPDAEADLPVLEGVFLLGVGFAL
ncbi:MAG TPA: hypothetical protein VFZ53_24410 [Polyangiaceae bacterium]